jgi:predicted O-methyltransferase YrrM
MRWLSTVLAIGLCVVTGKGLRAQPQAPEPPTFSSDVERHEWILGTLMPWMEQFRGRYRNVPRSDGAFLRWLIVATGRRRALEIGTANGYSALWLGLGLEAIGGHLTTVEIRPELVQQARANVERAGLEKVVTVIQGDALKVVPSLKERFDFVFLDIGPRPLPFFKAVEPKLTEEAIVVAHRPPMRHALRDYLEYLKQRPEWLTTIVQTGAPTAIVLSVRRPSSKGQ